MTTDVFNFLCGALIATFFGLALVFAGYKFFRFLLPIWGFFFGLFLGAQSIQVLFNQGFLATVSSWLVGFVVGLIFAVLSYPFYLFAVGIIAASLGYLVAIGVWLWLGLRFGFVMWIVAVLVSLAFIAVTFLLKLQKWVIVVATAILGAGLIVTVLTAFFHPLALLLENPVQVMLKTSPLMLILFLVLVILGIIVQARSPRFAEETTTIPAPAAAVAQPAVPAEPAIPAEPAVPAVFASPAAATVGVVAVAATEAMEEPAPAQPATAQPEEPMAPTMEPPAAAAPPVEVKSPDEIEKFKYNLEYIEGIGPVYAGKLRTIGVNNPLDLLEKGAFPKGREEIAATAGISPALVLKWVNHVDLFRIKGVGSEYADLLEVAGVDTVVELAMRVPENLHAKILSVNEEKKLVRQPPTLSQVQDWVMQAKTLPRKINY
jgi:predicted flap endonuclease-1-like 5' DNA nuclease